MVVGLWVIPLMTLVALVMFIVGAVLIGKHIVVYLSNPLIVGMFILVIGIIIYLMYSSGWFSW